MICEEGGMTADLYKTLSLTLQTTKSRTQTNISQLQSQLESSPNTIVGNVTIIRPSQGELEAVSKVLNIPEILEMILPELPEPSLLFNAQSVCKEFRRTVQDSLAIQRKLFFKPDPRGPPRENPFNFAFDMRSASKLHFAKIQFYTSSREEGHTTYFCSIDMTAPHRIADILSCRNMLVTQPPVTRMGILNRTTSGRRVEREDGVTFGHLLDVVESINVGRECMGDNQIDFVSCEDELWRKLEGNV